MTGDDSVSSRADILATLIEERMGIRGRGLEAKLRRAGRLLPGWVRREAGQLVQAQRFDGHPKLMMQIDPRKLDTAFQRCQSWLQGVDPAARRKAKLLNFLAANAANMLLVAAFFVVYLVWAGHL